MLVDIRKDLLMKEGTILLRDMRKGTKEVDICHPYPELELGMRTSTENV